MLMHDYEGGLGEWGGSWSCDDVNYEVCLQISGFSLIYINVNNVNIW